MRKRNLFIVLIFTITLTAIASKMAGTTTLKDLQPTGSTDKKTHKHLQFDFFFDAQNMQYTCRTGDNKSLNATDFVVGSELRYEISGDKGKLKTTNGKQVECKIVRVESSSLTRP
jgi:hypothetical protein